MKAEDIRHIALIGAGFIGPGIAQIFASKNYQVTMMDVKEEILVKAKDSIKSALSLMVEKGLGSANEIDEILSRITFTTDMAKAVGLMAIIRADEFDLVCQEVLKGLLVGAEDSKSKIGPRTLAWIGMAGLAAKPEVLRLTSFRWHALVLQPCRSSRNRMPAIEKRSRSGYLNTQTLDFF